MRCGEEDDGLAIVEDLVVRAEPRFGVDKSLPKYGQPMPLASISAQTHLFDHQTSQRMRGKHDRRLLGLLKLYNQRISTYHAARTFQFERTEQSDGRGADGRPGFA